MGRHISFAILLVLLIPVPAPYAQSNNTMDWTLEIVDADGDVGSDAFILLGSSEDVWITYYRNDNNSIKLVVGEAHNWQIETALSPVSPPLGFVLDDADTPGIIYTGASSLEYAYKSGGTWYTQQICGVQPLAAALTITPGGEPVAAYLWSGGGGGYFTVARRTGPEWVCEDVRICEFVPFAPYKIDVAVDGSGDPHVCVSPSENSPVQYWFHDGSSWNSSTLIGGKWDFSLALDSQGFARVAYAKDYLWIERRDLHGWHAEKITPYPDIVSPNVFIDDDDTVLIEYGVTYYHAGSWTHGVYYAIRGTAGSWLNNVIHRPTYSDGDIVRDSEDRPHFAYYDTDDQDLRYCYIGISTPVKEQTWGSVKSLFKQ